MSSPNGSSRGKTEAFEFNSEISPVSIPRQCRGNVFRSNQLSSRSCKDPVEVVYRNTLIPVWFGHFWLATIWPAYLMGCLHDPANVQQTFSKCNAGRLLLYVIMKLDVCWTFARSCRHPINQFLDNVEELIKTRWPDSTSHMFGLSEKHFLEIVEELTLEEFSRNFRVQLERNSNLEPRLERSQNSVMTVAYDVKLAT